MMMRFILFVLVMLSSGCKTSETLPVDVPPPMPAAGDTGHNFSEDQIRPGDKIEVFVMEDSSFNGIYVVREKGDIILPKIGRVKVLGMTISSAEQRIRSALEGDQLTKATVIADRVEKARGSARSVPGQDRVLVYLTGRVNRPGQHAIPVVSGGTIGVWEAVMIAGGIDGFGDDRKVYVLRQAPGGQRAKIPVNLRAVRMGDARDVPIGNGDIVVVPQARFLPL